ncbi:MAG: alpha/beta hydrolase [Flavobacteriales bacterium]|jgi:pimeloyl-ACP methyl ester carboxylesterase|uniref:alpha/beta fold hydrolase n=1 Tax=Blattabacterium sp. (Mastotermes darwiniensis) TaxID=39768 RepID=UPI000231DECF|nr:alpha/beta hydrolase [Blattabacterium sp. (Mastotermes darwiniensis)]AER40771.1 hydrolase protein of the alpha/beta superfamily [Blattabacterium sp. (Mastotermes darwiniensis) str. MADAR]MDR1804614.1 alpha/beta hydrolase [Flavobacteriales bacterium]
MFIYYNKKKIYYEIIGRGQSIIFLHGFMENLEIWNYVCDTFHEKYKVILIDFPGHGKSSSYEEKKIFSMEELADIVKLILEKENINKAVFIGHSMGGYISMALLEKHPEIFLGLCLLHSTAKSDTKEKKNNRIRSIQLAIDDYSLFVSSSINKLFNPKKLDSLQKEINFIKKMALSTSIHSVISFLRGMSIRKDRRFLLKQTKFPKLYVIGLYDLILPKKRIHEEAKFGYNSYSIEIQTGHMGPIEDPQTIGKILENFMKDKIKKCIK